MPLNPTIIHDSHQSVVTTDDRTQEELKPKEKDVETVLYVLDSYYRHTKIVTRQNDTEKLNSLISRMINKNKMVTIIPSTRLLEIAKVIEILGASPTYVKELRQNGTLKFFKRGQRQVIHAEDVFRHKAKMETDLETSYDKVIGMDQELYFHDS